MKRNRWLLLLVVGLVAACGQRATHPHTTADTPAQMATTHATPMSERGRWSAADRQAVADRYRHSWQYRSAEDRARLDPDKWIPCVLEKLEQTYENPYRVQQAIEDQSEELNRIGHQCDQASLR